MRQFPWLKIAAGVFVVACLGSIAGAVLGGSPDDARPSDVKKAQRTAVSPSPVASLAGVVAGNGVVEPKGREVRLSAAVAGRVGEVHVTEGQMVTKGQLLVTLESGVEQAALAAAEAELAGAAAEASRTLRGLRQEDVDAVIEDARAAEARAEQSQNAAERTKALAAKGSATPDELDRAISAAAADKATAKAAAARMQAAMNGSRSEDVLSGRARAEAARARRDQARAALARMMINATDDGEVLQLKFRPGEYFVPGGAEPLVVVGDTRELYVRMDVDERDIARVKSGASAHVTADAFGDHSFDATIVEIGRRMGRKNVRTDDPTERKDTKILEVLLKLNDRGALVPGQRVVGYIVGG
jgi:HlyD family secretion protein